MTRNGSTPVAYLTLGELLTEIEERTENAVRRALEGNRPDKDRGNFVYGLSGLASLLGCSKAQACRINTSGLLDPALTKIGALLIYDADKVLQLAREAEARRKQGKGPRRLQTQQG